MADNPTAKCIVNWGAPEPQEVNPPVEIAVELKGFMGFPDSFIWEDVLYTVKNSVGGSFEEEGVGWVSKFRVDAEDPQGHHRSFLLKCIGETDKWYLTGQTPVFEPQYG